MPSRERVPRGFYPKEPYPKVMFEDRNLALQKQKRKQKNLASCNEISSSSAQSKTSAHEQL